MTTNYEKIKNMDIEEMSVYIRQEQLNSLFSGVALSAPQIKKWLETEATDE